MLADRGVWCALERVSRFPTRVPRLGDALMGGGVLDGATGGGMVIYGPTGWLRVEVAPNQADRPTFFGGVQR